MIKHLFTVLVVVSIFSTQAIAQPFSFLAELSTESYPQNYLYDDIVQVEPHYKLEQYTTFAVIARRYMTYNKSLWFTSWSCTYYVAQRRPDLFQWYWQNVLQGNAHTWLSQAQAQWLEIWSEPKERAIAVFAPGRGAYALGHVAYVEYVADDGRIVISDMNYHNEFEITERIVPADLAEAYIY